MNTIRLFTLFSMLILLSACQLGAPLPPQPGSTPTQVATSVKPSAQPTYGPTDSFGAVIGPNYTPPPTLTQAPTPLTVSGPAPTGPTSQFGRVLGQNPAGHTPSTRRAGSVAGVPSLPVVASPAGPTLSFGPVIGPNYTPPPTLTQNAPPTPIPGNPSNVTLPPVATPGPSPTPGPLLRADFMVVQLHAFLTNKQCNPTLALTHTLV